MAYTYTLDATTPADPDLISAGAGKIRALTLSLSERLASIFVNVNNDPLVFKGFSQSTGTAALNNVTVAGTLGVTGVTTFTAGILANGGVINLSNFVGTAKIVGGTTGLSIRNDADLSDNVLVSDAGAVTVRTTLAVGAGRADFRNNATVSVSTSATTILASASTHGSFAMVNGTDGTNAFFDLVQFCNNGVNIFASDAGNFAQMTVSGSPVSRTYTCVSGNLKLAMASGTYSISVTEVRSGNTGA